MTRTLSCDVAVVGGGPAGLAAAVAARDSGAREVLVIERDDDLGGILQQCIHSGFGLKTLRRDLTGPEYAEHFVKMAASAGVKVLLDTMVLGLDGGKQLSVLSSRTGPAEISARAIVLATGCRERTRGQLVIPGSRPAGILTAGTAQRLVNVEGYMPGKEVVILGSGDVGLIMARRLSLEGARVHMVLEAQDHVGGLERNVRQCLDDFAIPLHLRRTVSRVAGKGRLEAVTHAAAGPDMRPVPGTDTQEPCDTLILSVGLIPENELARMAGVAIDPLTGGAVVDETLETRMPGIFACGNALQVHDLVDDVTTESQAAGSWAARAAVAGADFSSRAEGQVRVKAGNGLRYVVPQAVSRKRSGPVDFRCRSAGMFGRGRVELKTGSKTFWSAPLGGATPNEMMWFRCEVPWGEVGGPLELAIAPGLG